MLFWLDMLLPYKVSVWFGYYSVMDCIDFSEKKNEQQIKLLLFRVLVIKINFWFHNFTNPVTKDQRIK